jgi:hypothetical protein
MLLLLTLAILALLSRVLSENISVPLCRLQDELLPEMNFRTNSCYRCYKYMHESEFKPGMKTTNISLFIGHATVSYLSTWWFLFYL